MLNAIRHFFEQHLAPESSGADEAQTLQLATAALLLEMMRMDEKILPEERAAVTALVQAEFGLDAAATAELVALAESQAREATDYHQFTSLINKGFDPARKVRVVENLWRVAFADGRLDMYEEHLVRKIAELLYVPHSDFIAAKLRAREAVVGD